MLGLYETGIPWLAVLPLSAFAIRTVFIYPRYQRRRRINQAKAALLQPLIDADISHATLRNKWSNRARLAGTGVLARLRLRREISRYRTRIVDDLEKTFKLPTWRWASRIVPILILLAVSEAVRRLCNSKQGLLSILFGPFQPFVAWIATPLTGLLSIVQSDSSSIPDTVSQSSADHESLHTSIQQSTRQQSFLGRFDSFASCSWAQASLKTAGFSWCQDLTAPDPAKIMPAIFSATFFASVWFNPGAPEPGNFYSDQESEDTTRESPKPKRTFWQKVYLGFAALSFIPAMNMPCALLWYFIGNIAVSRLQTARLMAKYPILHPPVACKRPPMMVSRTSKLGSKTETRKRGRN